VTAAALQVRDVEVVAPGDGRRLLHVPEWTVRPGEHWAVVGGNGAGKTTLLDVAAGSRARARGSVEVLGEPHGAPGLRDPRLRISVLDGRPRTFAAGLTGLDVVVLRQAGPAAVLGAAHAGDDRPRARALLELLDAAPLADRDHRSCSAGERQRILLARALMRDPALLLLDEPVAALDLPGREALLRALERLARARPELASVTVTHHLEELPASTTHALLLRGGEVVASGTAAATLDGPNLSRCFGVEVAVADVGGRRLVQLANAA
jgi:iron complex transport system ATP-binding protein